MYSTIKNVLLVMCLFLFATTTSYTQSSFFREVIIAGVFIEGTIAGGDTVATKNYVLTVVEDSAIYTPSSVTGKLAYFVHEDTLSFVVLRNNLSITDGGANPDTLGSNLLPNAFVKVLPLGVQVLDSLATSDTLSLGLCDGATINTIYYNMSRNAEVKIQLELVDSLYQTTNVVLVDTTTVTTMKRTQTGSDIDNTTLTSGKILRAVFPVVATEPKGLFIAITGSY